MRVIIYCASLALFVISFSAAADESSNANYGVTFSSTNQLLLKKIVNESVTVYAGMQVVSSNFDGNNSYILNTSSTGRNYIIGIRDYLSKANLSKFANLEVSKGFQTITTDTVGASQSVSTSASLHYGIEYLLSSNLSIEGSAGVAFYWDEVTTPTSSYSLKSTAIPVAKLALTYYW